MLLSQISAWSNFGRDLWELGKLDDAITSLQKALAIDPDYAAARSNLGLYLFNLGRM